MRKLILILGMLALAGCESNQECDGWDCTGKKCWNDFQCNIGCFCYIATNEINGNCVSK